MKLGEMAHILDGVATTFENALGKTDLNDFREVAACFRRFPDDTVTSFCKYIGEVREGKATKSKSRAAPNDEALNDLVTRIEVFQRDVRSHDYAEGKRLAAEVGKLTAPNVKRVGERLGFHLSGTKTQMISRLENLLLNLKMAADQSSFSLTGTS